MMRRIADFVVWMGVIALLWLVLILVINQQNLPADPPGYAEKSATWKSGPTPEQVIILFGKNIEDCVDLDTK